MEYINRVNKVYYNPVGKACQRGLNSEIYKMHGIDSKGVVWEFLVKRTSENIQLRSAYPIHTQKAKKLLGGL